MDIGRKKNLMDFAKNNARLIVLVALILIGRFSSPRFLSTQNFRNILFQISIVGFLALGQTILMIAKEIDLSMGSLMAFAPISAIVIVENTIYSSSSIVQPGNSIIDGLALIIITTLLMGGIIGFFIGLIRVKLYVPSLIITLGLLYALRGGSYVLSGGHPFYMTMLEGFAWLGETDFYFIPVSFLFWLGLIIITGLLFKYTKVGNIIYAIGGNEEAAKFSGINVNRWKLYLFTFSGFCASISALIYSSRLVAVEVNQGSGYELTAVAIAVIGGATIQGGKGSIKGAFIGTLIFGVLLNVISMIGLVSWYNEVLFGLVIIGSAFLYKNEELLGRSS